MNIKSLLIGSAAALVAVSGARAADAIIAEPEPVEYVRVCDAYGAGFFYIPGTETCLQISGYVWFQVGAESYDDLDDTPSYHYGVGPFDTDTDLVIVGTADLPEDGILDDDLVVTELDFIDGFIVNSRARVNFDARSDTEWGTLRAYIRYQAAGTSVQSDIAVAADQAYIDLGGIRMGYTESAYVTAMKAGVAQYGSHSWTGLYYGYQQRQIVSYTFAPGNGFAITGSLEDDSLAGEGFVPDVVVAASYNQAWGGVWAKFGYDDELSGESDEGLDFDDTDDEEGYSAQIGVQFNMPNMPGSNLRVIGFYSDSDNTYNAGHPLSGLNAIPDAFGPGFDIGGSEFSILASYNQAFSETLSASIGVQYFDGIYVDNTDIDLDGEAFAVEASVVWLPITNFEIRGELGYTEAEVEDVDFDGAVSGFVRFTRYF